MKTQIENDMRIYEHVATVREISQLVIKYPFIQKFEGIVRIFSKGQIKISLKLGQESKISIIKLRVYLLGNNSYCFIDKTFDKIHCQGQLKFTISYISLSFFIFIAQKIDANEKKNGYIVVNIRRLNKIVFSDSYPLLL